MRHKIIYLLFLICLPLSAWAGYASNVRVRQRNKDIIITYDLSKTSNVQLLISTNKRPGLVPIKAVEGDVGKHVRAGKNKEIIWHPLRESDSFIADNVRFKVEALGSYEQYAIRKNHDGQTNMETFITADFAYSLTPQMSYGLMLGQTYNGIGWFVNARSNFNLSSSTNGYICGEGGYIDDLLPFYSGKKQSSLLIANAGFVLDVIELAGGSWYNRFNTFGFYVGAGYGWRRMLWETIDGQWIEYGPTSCAGVSGNAGILFSIYGLTIKAGVNTINFKYLDIEAGIGWMF